MMCQRIGWDPIGTIGLDGEELVLNPFNRLIKDRQLLAYKYEGFWRRLIALSQAPPYLA
jgi:hypothetical protein